MGDLSLSLWGSNTYKILENLIGYLIIRKKEQSGILFEEPTIIVKEEKNFILYFDRGTAFVIEKFSQPFEIINKNSYAIGFALTAAHTCFLGPMYTETIPGKILCGFNKNTMKTMELWPLKSWCEDLNSELRASNGNFYCLPGDVALCLIVSKNMHIDISEIPIGRCDIGTECSVFGFPSIKISNPQTIYPYLMNEKDAEDKIKYVFHKNRVLVESKGIVLCNEDLLEVSCSGIFGMSGSPVIVNGYFVGIFIGGPPLPGQRELLIICSMLKRKKNIQKAWDILLSIQRLNCFYSTPIYENLINDDKVQSYFTCFFILNKLDVPNELSNRDKLLKKMGKDILRVFYKTEETCLGEIYNCISECLGYFINVEELNFNSAISTKSYIFSDIYRLIQEFIKLDKQGIISSSIDNFFNP
ncbi:hypothetical protein SteCoe_30051 [Stentor coeruleus]|uniref:Peptidase S1 domain-containing protein n=1 Tax=Stentor coeruleus TaxID=5963 RepID=A0A1R2B4J0_9CILI|nr:hypothetical protein SteCoe_30051 [Stentor coeruleus]